MPPIRAITVSADGVEVTEPNGTIRTAAASLVTGLTVPQAQAAIDAWIAANVSGYQVAIHVVTVVPVALKILTADLGVVIPVNWWV